MRLDPQKTRTAREDKGFSQEDVAKASGLSKPTISRIERGFPVHNSTARLVAEVLEMQIHALRPEKAKRKN